MRRDETTPIPPQDLDPARIARTRERLAGEAGPSLAEEAQDHERGLPKARAPGGDEPARDGAEIARDAADAAWSTAQTGKPI